MNAAQLRDLLVAQLGEELVAAFVYGSVAHGTAGPTSDVDIFAVTSSHISPELRQRLATAATELQRSWGHCPDPCFPIEVFSLDECARAVHEARTGLPLAADDQREILHALSDRRISVYGGGVLDELTRRASSIVGSLSD